MARFTKEQVERLRATPMRDILAAEGYDTSHTNDGIYYSPFRAKENVASFHINDTLHCWFDHGDPTMAAAGKPTRNGRGGGDTIDFVRILKGCSFTEALEYLCRYNPGVVPDLQADPITVPRRKDTILSGGGALAGTCTETRIAAVYETFTDTALVRYAESRRVSLAMLQRYCREVHYECVFPDNIVKRFHAIGFPNSGGGWMLRWNPPTGRGKRSTGGGATLLSRDGIVLPDGARPTAGSVIAFEGFFDFLSWMEDFRPGGSPSDTDIVVLNSVANLHGAEAFLTAHRNVITIFDADKAGDKATEQAAEMCREAGIRHLDYRSLLSGEADYNDARRKRLLQGTTAA